MQALWERMARGWPVVGPTPLLREQLGADALDALDRLGLLWRGVLRAGASYPCRGCARGREVVAGDGLWAVCTSEHVSCEPMDLSHAELLAVDEAALVNRLRGLFALEGPRQPLHWRGVALLGERRLGSERVVFGLAPSPRALASDRLARWLSEQAARVAVLFAPTRAQCPAQPPPTRAQTLWLGLDQVVDLQSQRVDLAELPLRLDLPGADLGALLWPRYALVLEPDAGRGAYGGRDLALERHPRLLALLGALAARPGQWCTRRDLLVAVYPDEITARGRLLTDALTLDRRLRQLVSELVKQLKAVDAPELPDAPIENLRARSDDEGGYRLALAPQRVFVHSQGGL